MRRVTIGLAGLCLLGLVVGCHTCQHTAGVCDCYPPPVGELLKLPAGTYCHGHFTPSPTAGPMIPAVSQTAPPMPGVPGGEVLPVPPKEKDKDKDPEKDKEKEKDKDKEKEKVKDKE